MEYDIEKAYWLMSLGFQLAQDLRSSNLLFVHLTIY